jgi:phosphoribosylformylglycinamidine synthase subunit PurS
MGKVMKFRVQVMPKKEALDPQGRAVQGALERLGFSLKDCRIGKSIIVEVAENDKSKGQKLVEEMAQKLLANPLIETFEVDAL